MGVRVEFLIGRADGIESALLESIIPFQEWYRHLVSDPTSGFRADLLATIDAITQNGRGALFPRSLRMPCRDSDVPRLDY